MTKEEMQEYKKEYRKRNHYKLTLYAREYARTHKAERKAYYEKNKEKINAYSRKYYKENKWLWEDFYTPRAKIKGAKELEN